MHRRTLFKKILFVAILAVVVGINILYFKAVLNSDLPDWLKFILLSSK